MLFAHPTGKLRTGIGTPGRLAPEDAVVNPRGWAGLGREAGLSGEVLNKERGGVRSLQFFCFFVCALEGMKSTRVSSTLHHLTRPFQVAAVLAFSPGYLS